MTSISKVIRVVPLQLTVPLTCRELYMTLSLCQICNESESLLYIAVKIYVINNKVLVAKQAKNDYVLICDGV